MRQCMDCLLGQTLSDFELICVNDGSSDSSLEILAEYAGRDFRVRVISRPGGKGAGSARNAGLETARGEFLFFPDADDFFEPDMLETMYEAAAACDADISACLCDLYDEITDTYTHEKWKTLRMEYLTPYAPFNHSQLSANVFRVFMGWAWDKLFRRAFILKFNLRFQEIRTANDLYFVYSAIVLAARITVIPKTFAHHRINVKDSLSETREKSWDDFYKALLSLRETLYNHGMYSELEKDYICYALHYSMWQICTLNGYARNMLENALRDEWLAELGIRGKPASYLLEAGKRAWLQYKLITMGRVFCRCFMRFIIKGELTTPTPLTTPSIPYRRILRCFRRSRFL